jgi:hypothetical protein
LLLGILSSSHDEHSFPGGGGYRNESEGNTFATTCTFFGVITPGSVSDARPKDNKHIKKTPKESIL